MNKRINFLLIITLGLFTLSGRLLSYNNVFDAVKDGNLTEVERFILKEKVDINSVNQFEETILIVAINANKIEIVKFLIEHNADLYKSDDEDLSPFLAAIEKNSLEIVKLLVNNGVDPNKQSKLLSGLTPIILTIISNYNPIDILEFLIEHGADINQSSYNGNTALNAALDNNSYIDCNIKTVRFLLENGAKVNKAGRYGITPLIAACYCNNNQPLKNVELVSLLLKYGAEKSINKACSIHGNTPLSTAAAENNIKLIHLLLDNGAIKSINIANKRGRTPLYFAIENNNIEIVSLLLKNGSKVDKMSLELAKTKNSPEIQKLILG